MHFAPGIRQTPADIDLNRFAGAWHGENDSVDAVLSDQSRNVIGRINPQPRDGEPLQAAVVIDKGDGLQCVIGGECGGQLLPGLPGAVDQDAPPLRIVAIELENQLPQQKAAGDTENEEQHSCHGKDMGRQVVLQDERGDDTERTHQRGHQCGIVKPLNLIGVQLDPVQAKGQDREAAASHEKAGFGQNERIGDPRRGVGAEQDEDRKKEGHADKADVQRQQEGVLSGPVKARQKLVQHSSFSRGSDLFRGKKTTRPNS